MSFPGILFPRGVFGGAPPASITFKGQASSSSQTTSYTFNNVPISPGFVIIAIGGLDNTTTGDVSSVTIGGVTATRLVGPASPQSTFCALYGLTVASGTTTTVVVTFTQTMFAVCICSYTATGLQSTTPTATAHNESATANPESVTISCSAGGVIVGMSFNVSSTTSPTTTWSGITKDTDVASSSTTDASSASQAFAAAQTNLSVSASYSETGANVLGTAIAAIAMQ